MQSTSKINATSEHGGRLFLLRGPGDTWVHQRSDFRSGERRMLFEGHILGKLGGRGRGKGELLMVLCEVLSSRARLGRNSFVPACQKPSIGPLPD